MPTSMSLDAIKRINGANQAVIFGVLDYAMRIWLRPDRMAQLGITATDVANAVSEQNVQFAVGRIGQSPTKEPVPQTFPVITPGLFTEAEQFENIILRADDQGAAITRIKNIGRADLGRKDYSIRSKYQGKDATLIVVYQQPGANALDVANQVYATMENLSKSFPDGLKYEMALDTTKFVKASIDEVVHTFFEAVVLVVLVVFIFLHSLRLTIIPTLAVPVSILGAMIGMMAFGFSVNMMTLFGMILAIGIVVDDAIVVIENTERNMTPVRAFTEGGCQACHDRSDRACRGHRVGAECRVYPGGVPGGDDRRALQTICHHDCHFRGVLGDSRAHPLSGARRHPAQTQSWRERPSGHVV